MPVTILFFSANPPGTSALELDREQRTINDELERSPLRGDFAVQFAPAARGDDVLHKLIELGPTIAHFAAHGRASASAPAGSPARDLVPEPAVNGDRPSRPGELVLLDDAGTATHVPNDAIARLFKLLVPGPRCVVLNACHSLHLAKALMPFVNGVVIGTTGAISDRAAIAFSKGFYGGVFSGQSLETAFELGKTKVSFERAGDPDSFVLLHREGVMPAAIRLAESPVAAPAIASPPRATQVFVESPRLEEAVMAVERHLASGKRVVHVQGAPGDGKTQVGKWLEGRRGPGAVYVELPIPTATDDLSDAAEIWRQGLIRLIGRMRSDCDPKDDLSALRTRVRDAAERMSAPVTLILDNADSTAPFDLQSLLIGPNMACVVIGQGQVTAATKVDLRPPSPDEFVEMVREALGAAPLPPSDEPRVRKIGTLVEHAAIVAGYVADLVASRIPEELDALERELEAANLSLDARIQVVLQKAWANLDASGRAVALFLGAFAEPEIPLEWIPGGHWRSGTLSSLLRSRLVQKSSDGDGKTLLRAHRLIVQWLRSRASTDSLDAIARVLQAWSIDEELDEIFKSGGPRKRAFNRAFTFLVDHGGLDTIDPQARAFIELTYIDQSGLHADGPDDAHALEHQLHALAPDDGAFARLHPAVLGQLVDALRPRVIKHSPILRAKRARAIELLEHARQTPDGEHRGPSDPLMLIAEHHWGKYLVHEKRVPEGLEVLRRADALATTELARTGLDDRKLRLARRAKGRLQIADALAPKAPEAIQILAEEQRNAELPSYLRLTAVNRLLKHASDLLPGGLEGVVRSGLELCRICRHDEVAADFLASAVSAAREQDATSVLDEIAGIAAEKLDLLLGGAPGSRRQKVTIAFTNAKAAEGRTSADALSVFTRSMKLLELVLDPANEYDGSRALAMVRDAGAHDEAGAIADVLAAHPTPNHFTLYEIARTMRHLGRLDDADRFVEKMTAMAELNSSKRPLDGIYTRDERAKNASHRGDTSLVDQLLNDNINAARNAKATGPKQRFEQWLRALRERGALQARDGVLEDEWRAAERRRNAPSDVVDEVQAAAGSLARLIAKCAVPRPYP